MPQKAAHILLADDEGHVVHILGHALESEGYRLTGCSNGREALEACRRDPPDLVITDAMMPEMSGVELVAALAQSAATAAIPIIVLTGRGHSIDAEALQRSSVREICSKPFSPRAIVNLVGAILAETHDASLSRCAAGGPRLRSARS